MHKKYSISNIKYLISSFIIAVDILLSAQTVFAQTPVNIDTAFGGATGQTAETLAANAGLGTSDPREVVARVINVILGFLGIIAVALIIYAGFLWMTAQGNETQITTAKKIMTGAAIGLVIILAAFGIAAFVIRVLLGATGGSGGGICGNGTVESGEECGEPGLGSCPTAAPFCNACRCSNIPPGGQFPDKFLLNSTSPQNNEINVIRNVVISYYFNSAVKEASVTNSTFKVEQEVAGGPGIVDVNGVRTVSGARIDFVPETSCPAPYAIKKCFSANTKIKVTASNGIMRVDDKILDCSASSATCIITFTTGTIVDFQPPTISFNNIGQICAGGTVSLSATARDDSYVKHVEFFAGANKIGSDIVNNATPKANPFTAQTSWNTVGLAVGANVVLKATAHDADTNTAEATKNITLRAAHCCNLQQDSGETGPDCGGNDCAACPAAVCGSDVKQCTANNDACASGVCAVNGAGNSCVCQDVPIIDYVSMEDGAVGNLVTIGGRFFGDVTGKVYFCKVLKSSDKNKCDEYIVAELASSVNGNCTGAWQDKQIVAVVPVGAVSGPVKVQAASGYADESNDTRGSYNKIFTVNAVVRPGLCRVVGKMKKENNEIPRQEFQEPIVLHGINFGTGVGEDNYKNVIFGKDTDTFPSLSGYNFTWSPKIIGKETFVGSSPSFAGAGPRVPNIVAGLASVKVKVGVVESNSLLIMAESSSRAPFITKIEPVAGHAGDYVTITGGNFGAVKGASTVEFGATLASFDFPAECSQKEIWQNSQIIVKVPETLTAGKHTIKVTAGGLSGELSNGFRFGNYCEKDISVSCADDAGCAPDKGKCITANAPGLCKIFPDNGPTGAVTELWGDNFGDYEADNSKVVFYSYATSTTIAAIDWKKDNIKKAVVPDSPVKAKTGPVRVISKDNGVSNPLNFKVFSCLNDLRQPVEDACVAEQKCCAASTMRAGSCISKGEDCGFVFGSNYSQYYVEFSTVASKEIFCDKDIVTPLCQEDNSICADNNLNPDITKSWCDPISCTCETPKPPKVVEECKRKEGQCVTQDLPSPSPWTPNWDDGATPVKKPKACVNAIITARFDQKMDGTSITTSNITVKKCSGEKAGCDVQVLARPTWTGITVGLANTSQTYFSFYPTAEFSPNTWYQVTLKGGAGGMKAAGVNGLPLQGNDDGGGKDKNYIWYFKTRDDATECNIGCVAVAPSKLTVRDKKPISYQAIPDAEDNACIMINPASYTWTWDAAQKLGGTPVKATVAADAAPNTHLAKATPVGETATNDPALINATEQARKKKGSGELTISFSNFYPVKKWPDCATACRNAEVGILFSDAVGLNTLAPAGGQNIELYKCGNSDCTTRTKKDIKINSLLVSTVVPAEVSFAPANILDANAKYKVVVKGGASGVKSLLGKWLSDDKGTAQTEYTWDFSTQGVECAVDAVEMRPDKTYAYLIDEKNNHEAIPKSKADECSASGQRLVGAGYVWDWSTPEDGKISDVRIAEISNSDKTPADNKIDPAQSSTAIGKGTVTKKKLDILTKEREVQETKISAQEGSYLKQGQSDYYLICGFHNDNECRDSGGTDKSATYGVGANTCCYPRPYVTKSEPANDADKVCRNALVSVEFNEPMDIVSFNSNVLVAAKYENAACPENWPYLLLADASSGVPTTLSWLEHIPFVGKLRQTIARVTTAIISRVPTTLSWLEHIPLIGKLFNASTAWATDYGSNWCVVPGTVGGYNFDGKGYATFAPQDLLKAGSEHLILIKGDKNLTDGAHEGAKNIYGVSVGLPIATTGVICRGDTTGKDCKINGEPFFGQLIKFTALPDADNNHGICAADKVEMTPASHLFTTNQNKAGDNTIDEVEQENNSIKKASGEDFPDSDKLFIAKSLSSNGQAIVSIDKVYSWKWAWSIDNNQVAETGNKSSDGLNPNKAIILTKATQRNSTFARAKIKVDSDIYKINPDKEVRGEAEIWVMLCNNPWPVYQQNWKPFQDSDKNCQNSAAPAPACHNTNFEFYYCRDKGSALFNDDLPAISDNGAILRQRFACSATADNSGADCSITNACKKDSKDAPELCTGVLKEFLLTRPGKPEAPTITLDKTPGKIQFSITSGLNYYLFYGTEKNNYTQTVNLGKGNIGIVEYELSNLNLTNGNTYYFSVEAIDEKTGAESDFSNEVSVTPKRTAGPAAPTNLSASVVNNAVVLTWIKSTDSEVTNYKVYLGIDKDEKNEVRDAGNVNTYAWQNLDFKHTYYFAVIAVAGGLENDSIKITVNFPVGYWRLDEGSGTAIKDYSGNNIKGTIKGNLKWEGNFLSFDGGEKNYLEIPTNNILDLSGGKFTQMAWIKLADESSYQKDKFYGILSDGDEINTTQRYPSLMLYRENGTNDAIRVHAGFGDGTHWNNFIDAEKNLWGMTGWQHVAVSYDASTKNYVLYFNGVKIKEYNQSAASSPFAKKSLFIGRRSTINTSFGFIGSIAEVKIYNKVLTAPEIKNEYDSQKDYILKGIRLKSFYLELVP